MRIRRIGAAAAAVALSVTLAGGPALAAANYTPKPPVEFSAVSKKVGNVTIRVSKAQLAPGTKFAGYMFTFIRSGSTKQLLTTNPNPTWTWLRSVKYTIYVQSVASKSGSFYTSGKSKSITIKIK